MKYKVSLTDKTNINVRFQTYRRDMLALTATLSIGTLNVAIPTNELAPLVTINAEDLLDAGIGPGPITGHLIVKNANNEVQIKQIIEFDVFDDEIPEDTDVQMILCAVPVVINTPKGGGSQEEIEKIKKQIQDLINGGLQIKKLLFVDSDDNEFDVIAMIHEGLPTLDVTRKTPPNDGE